MAAQTLNTPASFNQHTLRAAAARHSLASALHWSTVSHRVPRLLEAHIRPPHHEETAAATSHTSGETETQESKVSVRKGPWWSLCLQDSRTGWPTAHFVWLVLKWLISWQQLKIKFYVQVQLWDSSAHPQYKAFHSQTANLVNAGSPGRSQHGELPGEGQARPL